MEFVRKCYGHSAYLFRKLRNNIVIKRMQWNVPTFGLNRTEHRDRSIIISLTSYNERFTTLPLCLKSLLKQTIKPDKIVLYLTEKDNLSITNQIEKLEPFGIEIKIVKDDLKPHKKYYYAMQEYPNSIIITVDDDVIYDKNLIKRLLLKHSKYPKAIVTDRARIINTDGNGFLAYKTWYFAKNFSKPSLQLLATGVGGVLYPPHLLNSDLLFNIHYIRKYISVDDLWLKTVEILNGIPTVTSVKNCNHPQYIEIPSSDQRIALSKANVGKNENDKYWMQLDKEFDLFNRLIVSKKKSHG